MSLCLQDWKQVVRRWSLCMPRRQSVDSVHIVEPTMTITRSTQRTQPWRPQSPSYYWSLSSPYHSFWAFTIPSPPPPPTISQLSQQQWWWRQLLLPLPLTPPPYILLPRLLRLCQLLLLGGYVEGSPGTFYEAQHAQVPMFARGTLVNGGECSVTQNTPCGSPLVAYICAVWARGRFDHQGRWCWHMWSPSYLLRFPPPTMLSTSPYPMWWGRPYFLEVVPHHIIVQVYTGVEEVGVSQEIKNRGGTLPPPPSGIVPEWPAQLAYTLPLLPPRRCLESPDQI